MRVGSPGMPPRRRRSLPTLDQLPNQSRQPFNRALEALKNASGWSYRDFAEQVNAKADPGQSWNHTYLQAVVVGREQIKRTDALLALIAAIQRATGIEPTYFREYREHIAAQRAAELAGDVGLDAVLAVLDELERRGA
jgi:hypothetical protein